MEIGFAEVQVWTFTLAAADNECAELEKSLTADEVARADRFIGPELRQRFVVARGRLRQLLGMYLQTDPAKIRFDYGDWGKPRLSAGHMTQHGNVHFNLSHSADEGAIAVSRFPVGVDLEVANPRTNHRAVRSQILSSNEEETWQQQKMAQPEMETMRLWVCKEAFLKATGLGIAEGLRKVDFPLPVPTDQAFAPNWIDGSLQLHLEEDASCNRNAWLASDTWRLSVLDSGPSRYLAICRARSEANIALHEDWPSI